MPVRLLPWAPERGTSMQFDADAGAGADDGATFDVDPAVEGLWEARTPRAEPPSAVQIVDGVRRAEAHALDEDADGRPLPGLFGSLAVGAVRCEWNGAASRAWILDGTYAPRVERYYLQAGGEPADRELRSGTALLCFTARVPRQSSTANDLVAALNRTMLDEEAKLAEALARDESALTLVDGPLRLRAAGSRVAGYVKRTHRWYIDAERQRLLPALQVGERTPLFRILASAPGLGAERYGWFVRIADLGPHFHPLAGVVRLEASGELPLPDAIEVADQAALVLPRLASSPARDPRAPQNLTPVGALETVLTRRLGDPLHVRRLLAAALASERDGVATSATLEASPTFARAASW